MSRGDFLNTRFPEKENKFNLYIPIQPNHKIFFEELASKFRPASKITDDIKELVTRQDFNLCIDKTILIFYQGDGYKLNTLKFYLFLNFLTNWKSYNDYISCLVPTSIVPMENDSRLIIETTSLAEISELRFREYDEESKQRLSYLYNRVDILFLTVSYGSRLFDSDFFKELFKVVVDIRSNSGLVTIIIFPGTEKNFNERGYDKYFFDSCIKRYNLTGTKIKESKNFIKSNSRKNISEEEDFNNGR